MSVFDEKSGFCQDDSPRANEIAQTRAESGDPAPGQEYDFPIDRCPNHGVTAGLVTLTDTLLISTIVVSWRPDNNQEIFRNLVSAAGGQVVTRAPGRPGVRARTASSG